MFNTGHRTFGAARFGLDFLLKLVSKAKTVGAELLCAAADDLSQALTDSPPQELKSALAKRFGEADALSGHDDIALALRVGGEWGLLSPNKRSELARKLQSV